MTDFLERLRENNYAVSAQQEYFGRLQKLEVALRETPLTVHPYGVEGQAWVCDDCLAPVRHRLDRSDPTHPYTGRAEPVWYSHEWRLHMSADDWFCDLSLSSGGMVKKEADQLCLACGQTTDCCKLTVKVTHYTYWLNETGRPAKRLDMPTGRAVTVAGQRGQIQHSQGLWNQTNPNLDRVKYWVKFDNGSAGYFFAWQMKEVENE